MSSQMILCLILLIALPFAGTLIGWLMMHKAVYNAETPTRKNQLNALKLTVFLSVIFGIVEAFLLYSKPSDAALTPSIIAGVLGLASSILCAFFASKQLELGFMKAPERYRKALNQCIVSNVLSIAGLIAFLVLAGII
ncbi:MAG: hypothetical protein VZT48_08265 [Bulleidia sp.]|nr:hypothetical protein [Bulleidia sp.]